MKCKSSCQELCLFSACKSLEMIMTEKREEKQNVGFIQLNRPKALILCTSYIKIHAGTVIKMFKFGCEL